MTTGVMNIPEAYFVRDLDEVIALSKRSKESGVKFLTMEQAFGLKHVVITSLDDVYDTYIDSMMRAVEGTEFAAIVITKSNTMNQYKGYNPHSNEKLIDNLTVHTGILWKLKVSVDANGAKWAYPTVDARKIVWCEIDGDTLQHQIVHKKSTAVAGYTKTKEDPDYVDAFERLGMMFYDVYKIHLVGRRNWNWYQRKVEKATRTSIYNALHGHYDVADLIAKKATSYAVGRPPTPSPSTSTPSSSKGGKSRVQRKK